MKENDRVAKEMKAFCLILNLPVIPSQSAKSLALARAVDSPMTLSLLLVCEAMKFVLDTIT